MVSQGRAALGDFHAGSVGFNAAKLLDLAADLLDGLGKLEGAFDPVI